MCLRFTVLLQFEVKVSRKNPKGVPLWKFSEVSQNTFEKTFFCPIWTFKVSIDSSRPGESKKPFLIFVALPVQKLQPFKVKNLSFWKNLNANNSRTGSDRRMGVGVLKSSRQNESFYVLFIKIWAKKFSSLQKLTGMGLKFRVFYFWFR